MQRIDRINDDEFDDILDSICGTLNVSNHKKSKNNENNQKFTNKDFDSKSELESKLIDEILNKHDINENLKKNELYCNVTSNMAINRDNLLVKKLKNDVFKNINVTD